MRKEHIIIRLFPSCEGGVYYAIYEDDADELDGMEEADGGLCTSHTGKDGGLTAEDWENALGMASGQAVALLEAQGSLDEPCDCEHCGEVSRHCPDCKPDPHGEVSDCPTCDGVGSVSR